MSALRQLNKALGRALGLEVRRVGRRRDGDEDEHLWPESPAPESPAPDYSPTVVEIDRLLAKPVFLFAPVRSGSTMFRLMLNAHSRLYAPHELHIRRLKVRVSKALAQKSMDELGLQRGDLEHLLWDRVMHRELVKSGKEFIVDKTPSNAFAWQRIADCWPDARFLFLIRHPASIAASWHESKPRARTQSEATEDALRYMTAIEAARSALAGLTVRYEDLIADPESTLRQVCTALDVEFEPGMLAYGEATNNRFVKGLGDWRAKIRTGTVQPGRRLPAASEVPPVLVPMCRRWGYLPTGGDAERDGVATSDDGVRSHLRP